MSLHPNFPTYRYAPLIPEERCFPADETLRDTSYEKLLPPLVAKVRQEVHASRTKGYPGASKTSVALLQGWFETDHLLENADGTAFLDTVPDVQAFTKNYLAVGFKLDYVKADGDLSNYTPDFIVRTKDGKVWIVETKGREELDLPQKLSRLKQWCADATEAEKDDAKANGQRYDFVFVDQSSFEKHLPKTFASLIASFIEYK